MSTHYAVNWNLASLFAHPATDEFRQVLTDYEQRLNALAAAVETLPAVSTQKEHVAAWVRFGREFEALEAQSADLRAFLGCYSADDAANKLYRQLEAAMSALDPSREKIYTSVEFAFQAVTDADFAAFLQADDWLQKNAFFLQQRRKNAKMRLPKAEELLAADLHVDGLHAWGRFFDRVSGELKIPIMEKGEIVHKSASQVRLDMPERPVRENNFHALVKAWKTVADHCADALNHISGTRLTLYRRLGLRDHLDMPCHVNRMSRETLSTMWSVVSQRKSPLVKYLDRKAALLGLNKLAWYDLTAPLPTLFSEGPPKKNDIGYDDGAELVAKTFHNFSPHMGDFARHAFERQWVEAENRSGKRLGAFCTGFPGRGETRVFMTYTNSYDDVSTLAHELGHAYHSWVLKDEPPFLQDYPMNLAETASTFAEAVLAEQRLQRTQSQNERLQILDHMLADAVVFSMNIHCRFIFEDNFHKERAGGELTAERLSALMLAAQKEAYLDCLEEGCWYPDFWVSKLHFYISGLPFYNFPYTFGYLLSTGLYALAGEGGQQFPDRYRKLLVATGCQEAEDAVQSTFGYDLRQPDFWHKSYDILDRRVQQFLDLTASLV